MKPFAFVFPFYFPFVYSLFYLSSYSLLVFLWRNTILLTKDFCKVLALLITKLQHNLIYFLLGIV